MSQENVEIVRPLIRSLEPRRLDAGLELIDPDVDTATARLASAWTRLYHGHEG